MARGGLPSHRSNRNRNATASGQRPGGGRLPCAPLPGRDGPASLSGAQGARRLASPPRPAQSSLFALIAMVTLSHPSAHPPGGAAVAGPGQFSSFSQHSRRRVGGSSAASIPRAHGGMWAGPRCRTPRGGTVLCGDPPVEVRPAGACRGGRQHTRHRERGDSRGDGRNSEADRQFNYRPQATPRSGRFPPTSAPLPMGSAVCPAIWPGWRIPGQRLIDQSSQWQRSR